MRAALEDSFSMVDVSKTFNHVNPGKATGPDSIPSLVLRGIHRPAGWSVSGHNQSLTQAAVPTSRCPPSFLYPRKPSTPGLTALGKLDPKESEMILEYFKTQVLLLKDKELLQKTVREEKKLLVENAKLKKDISDLKILLTEKQQKKKAKAAAASKLTSQGSTAALYAPGPNPKPGPVRERDGRRRRGERKGKRERTNSESALEEEPRMDVSRLDLRIGRIVGVRYHPLAGALYVQEVDLGEPAPRTVVSALRHIPKEQ
ncbi:aminoacyl tRNA synthase complex-interacting multifunctional protein 1-like, partial [Oncorhynchus keta]|uniref:aminoacyl tRNA synthase complex-interacting multifunctional protein 1-like n=1 Tax=Oncorhynchus keta TaxID=8018 RepID=UPI00227B1C1F